MSDHAIISLDIIANKTVRGKGYFKMNNSLLLEKDHKDKIKTIIRDTAEINKTVNPNTLWEIIKGSKRNETIKYAAYKWKKNGKLIARRNK